MKNTEAMDKAIKSILEDDNGDLDIDNEMIAHPTSTQDKDAAKDKEKKTKKDKDEKSEKKDKKDKKEKKRKSLAEDVEMLDISADGEQKKKKKRKSVSAA